MTSRGDALLAPVSRQSRIIEIGPSHSPIAAKSAGWNTTVVDHATREDLVKKYGPHGVNVEQIETVDYLWTGGKISDVIPVDRHGTFQAFVASHVIEHTPDLLAFLESAATLLDETGIVVLAIPDKRYCFDYFQPLTTTGAVLQAQVEGRSLHTPGKAFDHGAYAVSVMGSGAFGQHAARGFKFFHDLQHATDLFSVARAGSGYVDMHSWHFVPSSFELILLELAWLGHSDWRIRRITEAHGCEFFAWLERGGQRAARGLSFDDLQGKRLELLKRTLVETKQQIDFLLQGEVVGAMHKAESRPSGSQASSLQGSGLGESYSPPISAITPAPASVEEDTLSQPRFVDWAPSRENAVKLFDGEWSSAVPGVLTGTAQLFDDARIHWLAEKLGGFAGKHVLELGPLEAGHTSMMVRKGATVKAIESNTHAFLRCLVVKELLDLKGAQFVLGDFTKLASRGEKFDFALASGVLYHMTDPVALLDMLMSISDTIGLWTHYFDPEVLRTRDGTKTNFTFEPRRATSRSGRRVELYDQRYLAALQWKGFCGGSADGSAWMTRDGILRVLEGEGFRMDVAFDHPDHPNGPAFCVFAERLR